MGNKKLAIGVIHGMGSQGATQPPSSDTLTFSKDLARLVERDVGKAKFSTDVAWREIFWSDILQGRQVDYLKRIKRRTDFDDVRKFVLCNLSDASAYRPTAGNDVDTYGAIHQRVRDTIAELEADCEPGAPLILLAHSLGAHILSNYIYVLSKDPGSVPSGFQQMKRLMFFVTFGCNIPVFVFAYPAEEVTPIARPGTELPPAQTMNPWWYNFYDRDDVLGYPLKDIGPKYEALVNAGELRDVSVNAGSPLISWTPLSHNAYWKDADVVDPIRRLVRTALN